MKALDHHLYTRGRYYYFRRAIPIYLHQILKSKEFCTSLSTDDLQTARLFVAKLDIEFQSILNKIDVLINQSMSVDDIRKICELYSQEIRQIKSRVDLPQRQPSKAYLLSRYNINRGDNQHLFSNIVKQYLKDCVTNSPKTIEHKRMTYDLFQSLIGDVPINSITRKEARKFKEVMLRTPRNLTKLLKVDSYASVDWNNLPEGKVQSLVTVNNRIVTLTALFTWAEQNDLYEAKNPFSGLMIAKAKTKAQKRPPFLKEHLDILFSSPIYTGCKGEAPRERFVKGKQIIQDYKYWIPLIGLYTGMRLNEICQLNVDDIQRIEGIWSINIDDSGDRRLKTLSSRRRIPIHKFLLDLGLMAYVYSEGSGRLFKSLPKSGLGSYSYKFTKDFSYMLKKLDIKDGGLCFHSFRHTFIDGLRNAGVERSIAMKLVGHHSTNDIHNGYGYGHSLEVLQEHINKLSFGILEG